jgi:hypothetical protein
VFFLDPSFRWDDNGAKDRTLPPGDDVGRMAKQTSSGCDRVSQGREQDLTGKIRPKKVPSGTEDMPLGMKDLNCGRWTVKTGHWFIVLSNVFLLS